MIAYYILPSGKLTEYAKRVISILCLSALTVPLLSGAFKLPDFDYSSFSDMSAINSAPLSKQLCEAACTQVKSAVQACINNIYTGEYEIFVTADIQPDNSIIISELRVVLKSGSGDLGELSSRIGRETGLVPKIDDER